MPQPFPHNLIGRRGGGAFEVQEQEDVPEAAWGGVRQRGGRGIP